MIRKIGAGDWEVFKQLRLESLRLEPTCFASSASDWEGLSEAAWKQIIGDTDIFVFVLSEEPIGLASLTRRRGLKVSHRATIGMVYVRHEARGLGVGAGLIDALVVHARNLGIQQLELTASAANSSAVSFYESLGFVEIGRIPNGFIQDGLAIADVLMVRQRI